VRKGAVRVANSKDHPQSAKKTRGPDHHDQQQEPRLSYPSIYNGQKPRLDETIDPFYATLSDWSSCARGR
jgi:hypothetical protein